MVQIDLVRLENEALEKLFQEGDLAALGVRSLFDTTPDPPNTTAAATINDSTAGAARQLPFHESGCCSCGNLQLPFSNSSSSFSWEEQDLTRNVSLLQPSNSNLSSTSISSDEESTFGEYLQTFDRLVAKASRDATDEGEEESTSLAYSVSPTGSSTLSSFESSADRLLDELEEQVNGQDLQEKNYNGAEDIRGPQIICKFPAKATCTCQKTDVCEQPTISATTNSCREIINLQDPTPDLTFAELVARSTNMLCHMSLDLADLPLLTRFIQDQKDINPLSSFTVSRSKSLDVPTLATRGGSNGDSASAWGSAWGSGISHLFAIQGMDHGKTTRMLTFAVPNENENGIQLTVTEDKESQANSCGEETSQCDQTHVHPASSEETDTDTMGISHSHSQQEEDEIDFDDLPSIDSLPSARMSNISGTSSREISNLIQDQELRDMLGLTKDGKDYSTLFPTLSIDNEPENCFSDDGMRDEWGALGRVHQELRNELESAERDLWEPHKTLDIDDNPRIETLATNCSVQTETTPDSKQQELESAERHLWESNETLAIDHNPQIETHATNCSVQTEITSYSKQSLDQIKDELRSELLAVIRQELSKDRKNVGAEREVTNFDQLFEQATQNRQKTHRIHRIQQEGSSSFLEQEHETLEKISSTKPQQMPSCVDMLESNSDSVTRESEENLEATVNVNEGLLQTLNTRYHQLREEFFKVTGKESTHDNKHSSSLTSDRDRDRFETNESFDTIQETRNEMESFMVEKEDVVTPRQANTSLLENDPPMRRMGLRRPQSKLRRESSSLEDDDDAFPVPFLYEEESFSEESNISTNNTSKRNQFVESILQLDKKSSIAKEKTANKSHKIFSSPALSKQNRKTSISSKKSQKRSHGSKRRVRFADSHEEFEYVSYEDEHHCHSRRKNRKQVWFTSLEELYRSLEDRFDYFVYSCVNSIPPESPRTPSLSCTPGCGGGGGRPVDSSKKKRPTLVEPLRAPEGAFTNEGIYSVPSASKPTDQRKPKGVHRTAFGVLEYKY